MTRCPACFAEKSRVVCEYCDFDESVGPRTMCLPFHHTLNGGRYAVGIILGNPGGFGVAYKAWDHEIHAIVVIKEFQGVASEHVSRVPGEGRIRVADEFAEEYRFGLEHFRREADITKRFNDRHIVRVDKFFSENNTGYYVMPFVESGDLRAYMAGKRGRVPPNEALSIARGLLSALSVVHAKGYLHCDIKPSNVLLTHKKKAILIDFGAVWEKISKEGPRHYSEKYAPPELLARNVSELGDWSDIYLLCATLYECLSGEPPPQARTRIRAQRDPLVRIQDRVGPMDAALATLINNGLALPINKRPPDASTALALLEGKTIPGHDYSGTVHPTVIGTNRAHPTVIPSALKHSPWPPTKPQWLGLAPLAAVAGIGLLSSDPSAYFAGPASVLMGGYGLAWAGWVHRSGRKLPPLLPDALALELTFTWEGMEPLSRTMLAGESRVVGRSARATLRIANQRMSGEHVRITMSASGECTLEDMQSTNGTFIELATDHGTEWQEFNVITVREGRFMLGQQQDGGVLLDIRQTTVPT